MISLASRLPISGQQSSISSNDYLPPNDYPQHSHSRRRPCRHLPQPARLGGVSRGWVSFIERCRRS
eukprot:scaffold988_cov165-Ochromonas_danica.AAC.40